MNIFKSIFRKVTGVKKEIKYYLNFRRSVEELAKEPIWEKFNFSYGWLRQFGCIIRIPSETLRIDVNETVSNLEILKKHQVRKYVATTLAQFFDAIMLIGLDGNFLTYDIDQIEVEGDLPEWEFYAIKFSFIFKHLTLKFFISTCLISIVFILALFNFETISNLAINVTKNILTLFKGL